MWTFQQPKAIGHGNHCLNETYHKAGSLAGLYGEYTKRVDKGMGNDTGYDASAGDKQGGVAKAHCRGVDKLEQCIKVRRAHKQIYDMPCAEGERGDDYGCGDIVFAHAFEKQTTKNQLLQKAYKAHTDDMKNNFRYRAAYGYAVPEIYAGNHDEWNEVKAELSAAFNPA